MGTLGVNFKDLKVLVVDDQKLFREAVGSELEMLGCQTCLAEDGERGFQEAVRIKYDLIISDIRMPNWDGKKFLEEYRRVAKCEPPFVFMTGFADISAQTAYSMGADAFLGKPLNPEQLQFILKRLLTPLAERIATTHAAMQARYKVTKQFESLDSGETKRQFQLGRGGFFLAEVPELAHGKTGDSVQFEIDLNQSEMPKIYGIGRLAWSRRAEDEALIPGYGIEIDYLDAVSAPSFLKYVEDNSPLAVIPIGDA